jgi:hypothetical protein
MSDVAVAAVSLKIHSNSKKIRTAARGVDARTKVKV